MTEAGKANGTNSSASASGAKTRSRPNNEYVLYSYGEPVAISADGNASYFGTDILGSVRSVTDKYGTVQADYSYDAFGSPYLGNLENDVGFSYCGKSYDVGTGLYDYGFRDYSPVSARFTTVDPIRDGSNWFSYVVNDPVNYCDPFGLNTSDSKTSGESSISNDSNDSPTVTFKSTVLNTLNAGGDFPARNNVGKGNYGAFDTFAGIDSGNAIIDSTVNSFIGTYNTVATNLNIVNAFGWGIIDAAGETINAITHLEQTITNTYDSLKNEFSALKEDLGGYISQKANGVYQGLKDLVTASDEDIAYALGKGLVKYQIAKVTSKAVAKGTSSVASKLSGVTNATNKVDELISSAGKLERTKHAMQGHVKGDFKEIFNNLTKGEKPIGSGRYELADGTIVGYHISKYSGELTIDINRLEKVYKIRVIK